MKLDYDEISPITGKKVVIREGNQMICMESGYHTYQGWNEVDKGDVNFYLDSPKEVQNSRFVDASGQIWYKITLFTDSIVLKPTLYDGWEVNQFRDLYNGEVPGAKLQRIEKGSDGQDIIQVIDPDNAQYFHEFIEALDEFNRRKNLED